jgi:hydroxymethylglutaryl-CoA lyase
VPARITRQFEDMARLLASIDRPRSMRARAVVPNARGVDRALAADEGRRVITTIGFPVSVSESHNRANLGRSRAEALVQARRIVAVAQREGLETVAAVATAFGCPLEGPIAPEEALGTARSLADAGVRRLMLSDTTGLADPRAAHELFAEATETLPGVELIAHFHDTRGRGIANSLAAALAGATTIDCCLGGVGGEPDAVAHGHVGESGNVVTEDLVSMLAAMGIETGVGLDRLLALGDRAEATMGTRLRSQVLRSGLGLEGSARAEPVGRTIKEH